MLPADHLTGVTGKRRGGVGVVVGGEKERAAHGNSFVGAAAVVSRRAVTAAEGGQGGKASGDRWWVGLESPVGELGCRITVPLRTLAIAVFLAVRSSVSSSSKSLHVHVHACVLMINI